MLDLGSGSLRSLARLGEPFADLRAVGLTHRHQDHVADLLPLLFALRHTPGLERRDPLDLFGYRGLEADLGRLRELYGEWVRSPGFELRVHEVAPGDSLRLASGESEAHVAAVAVRHTPEAVGFRIELGRRGAGEPVRVAYTGDSGATDSLVELGAGVDLFVSECAFPDDLRVEGHLTPSELLPIAATAGARRTVPTHFYPVWDARGVDRVWLEAQERFGTPVPLTPAFDGLRVELGEADPRR